MASVVHPRGAVGEVRWRLPLAAAARERPNHHREQPFVRKQRGAARIEEQAIDEPLVAKLLQQGRVASEDVHGDVEATVLPRQEWGLVIAHDDDDRIALHPLEIAGEQLEVVAHGGRVSMIVGSS